MEKSQASEPRREADQTVRLPIDTKDATSPIRIPFSTMDQERSFLPSFLRVLHLRNMGPV